MVYSLTTKGTAPLLSSDEQTLLTEKSQILERLAAHLRGLLNRHSITSDDSTDRPIQVETIEDLDQPPSLPFS
ncbi:hypothetical protein SprV_0100305900 [Sparganum proliferum]